MLDLLAFVEIEHLGTTAEERADMRMGTLAAIFANAHRNEAAKPDPFTPSDFLPRWEVPGEQTDSAVNMSPEDFSALLHARFPMAG